MVILGKWKNQPITLSLKPNCLTLSIERGREADVYSFDLEGRPWTAFVQGVSYRRGLDGKIIAKWTDETKVRHRRWLNKDEGHQFEELARQEVMNIYQAIQQGNIELSQPFSGSSSAMFERVIEYDALRAQADIAHYYQVYKPVGILPPDQYFSVVLQVTEGCAFNTCTYCSFYRDRPFRIKGLEDFRTHARQVLGFLGEGLSLRRTLFLGDANALVVPMSKLVPLMEVVHEVFDVESLGGMFAFLDGFSGEKKTASDYRRLASLGLQRVYIGMESGNRELLKFLRKPGDPEDVLKAIHAMKEGGVSVGVIILLGAGGKVYAREHIEDTIRLVNQMNLDMDDLIYFSELVISEGMQYTQDAYQAKLAPLSEEERTIQAEMIEERLVFSTRGGTPHISRYDIREFVY